MKKISRNFGASRFKQWTRKRYAVFCSIGKYVTIGVLSAGYTLVGLEGKVTSALAQTDATVGDTLPANTRDVEDIIVEGVTPAALQAGTVIAVWQKSRIEGQPADNLQAFLNTVANIDIRQRGGNGVQADIRMRGGSEEQTLILLNGINVSDPQSGHNTMNLPIDLENIDRIEVLHTPNSFAGAVNIITGSVPDNHLKAHIGTGRNAFFTRSLHAAMHRRGVSLTASASAQSSDGYRYNTDFDILNIYAQGRYTTAHQSTIEAQFGWQTKKFGANSFYSVGQGEYENARTLISSLSYVGNISRVTLRANAYHRRSYDNYARYRDSLAFTQYNRNKDNYHLGDVVGSDLYASWRNILGHTTLGAQVRGEHIFSNKLGDPMSSAKPSFADGINYTHAKWRTVVTASVNHSYVLRQWTLSACLTDNYSNSFGNYACYSIRAERKMSKYLTTSASITRSMRLPTFTDLYYNGKGYISNPNLKPEQSLTCEVNAEYRRQSFAASASVFYRNASNLIDWVRLDSVQQCRNHLLVHIAGVECGLSYTFGKYLRNMSLSYAFLDMRIPKNASSSAQGRLFSYLKHKAVLSCEHQAFLPQFQFMWRLIYEHRNGSYQSVLRGASTPFTPVLLADLRLQYQHKYFSIYTSVENASDVLYYDYNAVPQPRVWYKAGVRLSL